MYCIECAIYIHLNLSRTRKPATVPIKSLTPKMTPSPLSFQPSKATSRLGLRDRATLRWCFRLPSHSHLPAGKKQRPRHLHVSSSKPAGVQ